MESVRLVYLSAIVLVCFNGTVPYAIGRFDENPVTIATGRLAVGWILLSVAMIARGRFRRFTGGEVLAFALTGFCFAIHWLLYTWSCSMKSSAGSGIGLAFVGVFSMMLTHWLDPSAVAGFRMWASVFLGFVGAMFVALTGDFAMMAFATSVCSAAFYAVMLRVHKQSPPMGYLERGWGQMSFALLTYMLVAVFVRTEFSQFDQIDWIVLVAHLGMVATAMTHTVLAHASSRIGNERVGIISYLLPVVAIGMGALAGQTVTPLTILGAGMILAANASVIDWRVVLGKAT